MSYYTNAIVHLLCSCALFFCILCMTVEVQERIVPAEEGKPINICCDISLEENNALFLSYDEVQIRTLLRTDKYSKITGDWEKFAGFNLGYEIPKDAEANETLCLTKSKAVPDDSQRQFKCTVKARSGLGVTVKETKIQIKVYKLPTIEEFQPNPVITSVGQKLNIPCQASGSPDLNVVWKNKDGNLISQNNPGESSATLIIDNVVVQHHEAEYLCEASINYPISNQSPPQGTTLVSKKLTINVEFAPEIKITSSTIHVDTGEKEAFNITVRGFPEPELTCPLLNIPEPRRITLITNVRESIYEIIFDTLTKEDAHDYECTARNAMGVASQRVTLTLGPSNLEIVSGSSTNHSDYYLLHWRARSKASMKNITIVVEEENQKPPENPGSVENSGDNSANPSTLSPWLQRTHVINLNEEMANPSLDASQQPANKDFLRQFAHDLVNLTDDKLHQVSIKVCNRHECLHSGDRIQFRTPKDDGKNKIDKENLKLSRIKVNCFPPGCSSAKFCVSALYLVLCIFLAHLMR